MMYSTSKYKLLSILFIVGCGTLVGNPKQPSEDGTGNETPTVVTMPEIDFSIHSNVSLNEEANSSLMLTLTPLVIKNQSRDILNYHARQTVKAIRSVNRLFRRLKKQDQINKTGKFFNKGELGKTSVEIRKIQNSEYNFESIICHEENIVTHTKWNDEGKIESIFSHKIPSAETDGEILTRITLSTSDGNKYLSIKKSGIIDNNSPIKLDKNFVTSFSMIKNIEQDSLNYKFVSSWYNSEAEPEIFEPTRYLSASSYSDKTGLVAAWNNKCGKGFDETNSKRPGWCFARFLEKNAAIPQEEFSTKIKKLIAIGIESKNNLETIKFDQNISCPAK